MQQAWSYQHAIQHAQSQLNHESAKLEAEILLCHLLKISRAQLYTWPERELTDQQAKAFFDLVGQRQQGQPIAYLTGQREFWGLNLHVNPNTLIPRADTETLVDIALHKAALYSQPELTLLDLGTGSGAIALALASELPQAEIHAIDYSNAALATAQSNAQQLNLAIQFYQGSWFEPVNHHKFDIIVSNPPYIESTDPHLSQGDLRFEPSQALASGTDGLDDLRVIISQAQTYLASKGWLMVEHGYNQALSVADLFKQSGYQAIELITDLAGQPRVTIGQKP
ncbi:MAG: peptide chain release factor N(5)-glutamine methyltransferase [Thiomicrospira sp.]|uniref:peptide chain release factor N(5)-glutamine methyltransferase n=1 Tax=Thiomicrospira sp. TaxID=935 RepID=UPI001A1071FD|nr:peptide chain release factor N(5)-glutamine methyltransferase [Thiomicrospira sp.]MBE0493972.1 peptide chain release factor N(5)-glutamine methyltransferase [Thiomicrospira sp.]